MNTRGRKVRAALVFLLFIPLVGYSGIEAKEKTAAPALKKANISAEKLVEKMERRARKIRDLKAEIVCRVYRQKEESKLTFEFRKPATVRLEGEYYWDWVSMGDSITLATPEGRIRLYGPRKEAYRSLSIDWASFWFLPGNFLELSLMPARTLAAVRSYRVAGRTSLEGRKAYVLEIEPEPEIWGMKFSLLEGLSYLLYVDAKRLCPLRLSVKGGAWKGRDFTFGKFKKLKGGLYLPTEVQSGGGVKPARLLFSISQVVVNKGIPDERFEVAVPDHWVVRDFPVEERREYEKKIEENPEDINLLYGLAFVLKEGNEFEAASRLLQKAASIDPAAAAVKIELAEVLDRAGNWEEAVEVAEAASQQWPEMAAFSESLAELYAKLDRPDDSLSALAKIRGTRRYGWLGRNVASILERQERYETAEKILKEIITGEGVEDTWRLRAVEKLVRLSDEREKLGELKAWWQEQLKEEPKNRFFKKGQADTFLQLNEKEEAVQLYAELEEEAADDIPFVTSLAGTLNREKMYKESEEVYSSLLKRDLGERQRGEVEDGLASIYMRTGREEKAIAHYKEKVVNKERNWMERRGVWWSLKSHSREDPASVKAWVEEKIKEAPDDAIYQRAMAEVLESEGEYEKAIPYYLKSLEAPSPMECQDYSSLAGCYRNAGDQEKAIATYKKMLEKELPWPWARRDLAETYLEAGDKEKAREAVESYLAHSGKDARTFSRAGRFYQDLGDYEKAEEYVKKAIRYAYKKNKPEYRIELAELYKKMGKDALAEAEAKKALEGKPSEWLRRRAQRLLGEEADSSRSKVEGYCPMPGPNLTEEKETQGNGVAH